MRKIRLFIALLFVSVGGSFAAPTATPTPSPAPTPAVTESSSTEKPRLGDDTKPMVVPKKAPPTETLVPPAEPPARVAPAKVNTKPTLGDIPENAVKEKKERKDAVIPDGVTPEDRKKLLEDVAQEFYEKGELAIQQGRLQEARDLFERALTLQPGHVLARARLSSTIRALDPEQEPPPPPKTAKESLVARLGADLDQWIKNKSWDKADRVAKNILAVDPNNEKTKTKLKLIHRQLALRAADRAITREKAGDFQGAVDAYRVAISYNKDQAYTEKIEELSEKIGEANDKRSEELYLQALDASQNGNAAKAMELCRDALQLNPDNIQATRMLDRLQSKPNP